MFDRDCSRYLCMAKILQSKLANTNTTTLEQTLSIILQSGTSMPISSKKNSPVISLHKSQHSAVIKSEHVTTKRKSEEKLLRNHQNFVAT